MEHRQRQDKTNLRSFLDDLLEENLVGKTISPIGNHPPSWPKGVNEGRIVRVYYYHPEPINLEIMFKDDDIHLHDIGLSTFEYYRIR